MKRLLPASRTTALYGIDASRRIEREMLQAQSSQVQVAAASGAGSAARGSQVETLMQQAGRAVARLALATAPHTRNIWIAAGPGNNGGDGLEAAIHLQAAGRRVHVTLIASASPAPADAVAALEHARAAGVTLSSMGLDDLVAWRNNVSEAPDLAIDALLGLGGSRAPQAAIAAAIEHLNALSCPVLSIDLPSGLHAETGQWLGDACVNADHTLCLLTAKPGLFTGKGRDQVGTVWLDTLGTTASADGGHEPDGWLTGSDDVRRTLPSRPHAGHKGSFGDVAIVGGASGMTGAALLAARSAHASGAGRVYVDLLDSAGPAVDAVRPELMFRHGWHRGPVAALEASIVVCGCGGGDAVHSVLPQLLRTATALVLDADALNAVSRDTALQDLLQGRAAKGQPTILTPHPLEAARLLDCTTHDLQSDRIASAQRLADRFECVVVLKGSGTIIAAPGRRPHVNPSGNASLATAGTGDVLAGWIGGLWAQAMGADSATASSRDDNAFISAVNAVFVHGAAADRHGASVLRAADLIDEMKAWSRSA
ncbi:MAG: carbohydrate kinase [Rhizobacter sp.]|nr:carbohydrate kinase [Rhizobacter sp.]